MPQQFAVVKVAERSVNLVFSFTFDLEYLEKHTTGEIRSLRIAKSSFKRLLNDPLENVLSNRYTSVTYRQTLKKPCRHLHKCYVE